MEGQSWSERRRSPRSAPRGNVLCRVDVRLRVHVVDISATGALLATETPPQVGSAALLKSGLGASTFASEVEIRRAGEAAGGPAVGVRFTDMDERNRHVLDQFLRKASS